MRLLRSILASSRYIVLIAVLGTLAASLVLLVYEALVVAEGVVAAIRKGIVSPADAKLLELAAALALMIGVLILFLSRKSDRQGRVWYVPDGYVLKRSS